MLLVAGGGGGSSDNPGTGGAGGGAQGSQGHAGTDPDDNVWDGRGGTQSGPGAGGVGVTANPGAPGLDHTGGIGGASGNVATLTAGVQSGNGHVTITYPAPPGHQPRDHR